MADTAEDATATLNHGADHIRYCRVMHPRKDPNELPQADAESNISGWLQHQQVQRLKENLSGDKKIMN